ncbi:MAG: hypothetical protein QOG01_924 [Pseudonocardiales bacterium]|jgi:uncharacterized membrane protein YgcG|nr:hypothetical protein [Pseudonocardiales bacterium]
MIEPANRPSRWGAPLLIAPCAAVMFGAAVWWAGEATPTTASTPAAAPVTSAPAAATPTNAGDERLHRELARTLATRRKEAAALQRRLRHLKSNLAHARGIGGSTAGSSGSDTVGSSGSDTAGSSGGGGGAGPATIYTPPPARVVAPPPAPVVVPAPPPPPVHSTTGASG